MVMSILAAFFLDSSCSSALLTLPSIIGLWAEKGREGKVQQLVHIKSLEKMQYILLNCFVIKIDV